MPCASERSTACPATRRAIRLELGNHVVIFSHARPAPRVRTGDGRLLGWLAQCGVALARAERGATLHSASAPDRVVRHLETLYEPGRRRRPPPLYPRFLTPVSRVPPARIPSPAPRTSGECRKYILWSGAHQMCPRLRRGLCCSFYCSALCGGAPMLAQWHQPAAERTAKTSACRRDSALLPQRIGASGCGWRVTRAPALRPWAGSLLLSLAASLRLLHLELQHLDDALEVVLFPLDRLLQRLEVLSNELGLARVVLRRFGSGLALARKWDRASHSRTSSPAPSAERCPPITRSRNRPLLIAHKAEVLLQTTGYSSERKIELAPKNSDPPS